MEEKVRMSKPEATYGILLKAIKANHKDLVEEILRIDRTYFHDEGSLDIRKESCYLREAIYHKNNEILQLLQNDGLPALIYKEMNDNEEERWQSNIFGNGKRRILIDPKEPFITEDYRILSLLIDNIDDINKPYELGWKGKDGRQYIVHMTLLASALYFNRLSIVELLVRKGAGFRFNLFETIAEVTRDTFGMGLGSMGPINSNPLITGYCIKEASNPDILEMYYKWSPISIVFQKGNSKLIRWIMQHMKCLPQEIEEVKLAVLQLRGDSYEEFAKRYPEIVENISLKEILRKANHRALRYHLLGMGAMSGNELLCDIKNLRKQSSRSWEDILENVMTEDFLLCIKEILKLAPELIQSEEVQKGIFNFYLFFLYMGNVSSKTWNKIIQYQINNPIGYSSTISNIDGEELFLLKTGICKKIAEGVLCFCTLIRSKTQDATEFMEWYYAQRYREPFKELKNKIRILFKEKPRLDIGILDPLFPDFDMEQGQKTLYGHKTLYEGIMVTMTQLNDIMDLFTPYDNQSLDKPLSFHGFHRAVVQKNNLELVKKMAANGYITNANLEFMVDHAIDVKSDTILPYLINYKWKGE